MLNGDFDNIQLNMESHGDRGPQVLCVDLAALKDGNIMMLSYS